MNDYLPSRSRRARDQVARYESTNGVEANTLEDRPVVVLTMTGARTGAIRKTPVMRVEHEGTYAAIASAGGQPANPSWYHNLVAHPVVQVQDGATRRTVRAREIRGVEKDRWWSIADSVWPPYAQYRQRSPRDIPVFLLEPVKDA